MMMLARSVWRDRWQVVGVGVGSVLALMLVLALLASRLPLAGVGGVVGALLGWVHVPAITWMHAAGLADPRAADVLWGLRLAVCSTAALWAPLLVTL